MRLREGEPERADIYSVLLGPLLLFWGLLGGRAAAAGAVSSLVEGALAVCKAFVHRRATG